MTTNEARKKNRKKLEQAEKFSRADDRSGAEKIWRAHLKDAPEDADVLFNVGVCIQRRAQESAERHEAATFFNRVVSSPEAPMERKADALNNLGLLMESIGESEKAMVAYGFALKMHPMHKAARVNLGDSHRHFGNFHQADEEFRVVLSQDDASPEAHFCAGMIALLLGDYKRGWEEYRWRVKVPNYQTKPFVTDKPKWNICV
jgi:Tfp pilus assembly protein PilF